MGLRPLVGITAKQEETPWMLCLNQLYLRVTKTTCR